MFFTLEQAVEAYESIQTQQIEEAWSMTNFLQSWNDTPTKKAIRDFVATVTDESGPGFVPPTERIAVFDNDGTLWCEKPMYIQLDYLLRRLAAQAERDASLRSKQPWQAAWEKDFDWLGGAVTKHYQGDGSDLHVLLGGILTLSEGKAVEEVEVEARRFIENERHPTLGLPYRDCIYQPMLELLQYLEANGFVNYIVSGGGRDFMRGFAHDLYGIPRERIIGSTVAYRYVEGDAGGAIEQRAELDIIDDGPGKPVQIWNLIGRRPILAAGNSNGDLPMLAFAGGPSLPALRLLVVHDDADREFDYVSGAEKVLSAAQVHGWTPVSIKSEWRRVFPG
jgi:phosphoserine phosphatase